MDILMYLPISKIKTSNAKIVLFPIRGPGVNGVILTDDDDFCVNCCDDAVVARHSSGTVISSGMQCPRLSRPWKLKKKLLSLLIQLKYVCLIYF